MRKCHICGGKHRMVATPYMWDGEYCPYDPEGRAKLSQESDTPYETQWWLAELDQYDNPTLVDGAHSAREGAEKAKQIIETLGFNRSGSRKFAIAEVRLYDG